MQFEAQEQRRRFTVEDVYRMVSAGVLDEDEHVELLDGELCVMSPQGTQHSTLTVVLHQRLERAFGEGFHVRDHSPMRVDDHNLPEPDTFVVRGDPRDYFDRLPTPAEVPIVVEVSYSSGPRDRRKAAIYAAGGVPIYWILDVQRRCLTEHRDPDDGAYRTVRVLAEDEHVESPTGAERWAVRELLGE